MGNSYFYKQNKPNWHVFISAVQTHSFPLMAEESEWIILDFFLYSYCCSVVLCDILLHELFYRRKLEKIFIINIKAIVHWGVGNRRDIRNCVNA